VRRLRLPARAARAFNGGRPGDLYVSLPMQPHPLYGPMAATSISNLPLAPWEAVLGASVNVPTLAGTVGLSP